MRLNFKVLVGPCPFNSCQVVTMTANGNLLYCLGSLFYAVAGCIMGTIPGGEFTAAAKAARNVGARLILVDRSQRATLSRVWARVKTRRMKKDRPPLLKRLQCYLNGKYRPNADWQ